MRTVGKPFTPMARNVSEHEIDALLARGGESSPSVATRDFREPRRLSADDLDALRRPGETAATAALEAIRVDVPGDLVLEPVEVAETTLELALGADEAEFVAAVGEASAGQCLALLDAGSAVLVAEAVLGTDDGDAESSRALTPLEGVLVGRLLVRVLERAAAAVQVPLKDVRGVASRGALAREIAVGGDTRRLALRVPFTAPFGRVVIHVLLTGVKVPPRRTATAPSPKDTRKAGLPAEIAPTRVELRAVLARTEILLTELLALEPGDVITLDTAPGQPIALEIEGQVRAEASFGTRDGHRAVRIQQILRDPDPR
ncbi:MAG: FliM/FliN family flagellar motor switch protein [Planctomycetes bacterium]|nr:FliM/FliN family flagellar motor switch protein [Planctomycetota bacterium]